MGNYTLGKIEYFDSSDPINYGPQNVFDNQRTETLSSGSVKNGGIKETGNKWSSCQNSAYGKFIGSMDPLGSRFPSNLFYN